MVRQPVQMLARRSQARRRRRLIDFVQKARRQEGMVWHLKPSRNHVDGDVEIQVLRQRHYQEQIHSQTADERVPGDCGVNKSRRSH